jgi:hypothetical protein
MKPTLLVTAALLVLARPLLADCKPDEMLVVTAAQTSKAKPTSGFASKPKTFYRVASRYARIEEQVDAENGIHGLVVINEPDTWMVNLLDATGRHIVDDRSPAEFHMVVITPTPQHWRPLEFGTELAFMRANGVVPVHDAARSEDVYTHTSGGITATLRTTRAGVPLALSVQMPDRDLQITYQAYECRPPDLSLFVRPANITYTEPRPR